MSSKETLDKLREACDKALNELHIPSAEGLSYKAWTLAYNRAQVPHKKACEAYDKAKGENNGTI